MKKIKNTKKILLSIFLSLFIIFIGMFCIDFISTKKHVHADTSGNFSSTFQMVQGISIGGSSDEPNTAKGKIQVRLTEEIYNLLYTDGEDFHQGNHGWFHSIGYRKSKYYLMFCCSTTAPAALSGDEFVVYDSPTQPTMRDYNEDYQPDVFSKLYSAHPEDSDLLSEEIELSIDREGYYIATFTFPLPASTGLSSPFHISLNYDVDYYYYVDVVYSASPAHDYEEIVTSHGWAGYKGTVAKYDGYKKFKCRSVDYVERNSQEVAQLSLEYVSEELGLDFVTLLNEIAGYTHTSDTYEVQVKYKKCYGFNDFREEQVSYFVNSLLIHSSSYVYQTICNMMGYVDISAFNCIYENYKAFIDGTVLNTDRKVVLQANGYNYSFNDSTHTGTLTIEYTTFHYKDFCVKLTDNDEEDAINLSMYIYATDIQPVADDRYCLTFDFSTIIHQSFASVGWIFELKPSNFNIVDNSTDVTTELTSTSLKVFFTDEEELAKISITALAEIIPDYECTISVSYVDLTLSNGDIVKEDKTLTDTMMYSELITIYNPTSFYNRYKTTIQNGLTITGLTGIVYYEYSNLSVVKVNSANYNINVSYTYNTLVKISNNVNNSVKYYNLSKNSLTYNFSEFNYTVPTNYRVKNLSEINGQHVTISFNELYPNQATLFFNVNVKQDLIIKLKAELSDKWPVKINYLKQYEDSCFATMETFSGEISLSDYPNLDDIDGDDIENIIGAENVKHIMFGEIPIRINDDTISFEKTGNSYEFNFEYSYHYIKTMDSNGNANYYNVPLTPFSKWQQCFGEDWSIVALAPDVFTYSDEVDPDKLYGFFSVMTFQEQVSNFNSWFHEYAGGGCCNFFSQKQIQGSDFYRFMANNPALLTVAGGVAGLMFGHPIAGATVGTATTFSILSISEALNEDNGIYYSYFLYLDGTTDKAFSAHNGADNYDDENGAFHNTIEKVKDSPFFQKLGVIGVIILGIVFGVVFLLLWNKLFIMNIPRIKTIVAKIIFIVLAVGVAVLIGFYGYWVYGLVMSMGGL